MKTGIFECLDSRHIDYYLLDFLVKINGVDTYLTLKSSFYTKYLLKPDLIDIILENTDFTAVSYYEGLAHISFNKKAPNRYGNPILSIALDVEQNLEFLQSIGFSEEKGTLWRSTGVNPHWCIADLSEVDGSAIAILNKFIEE